MKELLEVGEKTDLEYSESCEALVGRVKQLNVVIKENEKTKSYGCLMWVRKSSGSGEREMEEYLAGQAADRPHIVKHYKATERGAAVALVKYNDAVRNIRNIQRFLGELADAFAERSFVNCCYRCGRMTELGIFKGRGTPVQLCSDCAEGELVKWFGEWEPPVTSVETIIEEATVAEVPAAEEACADDPEKNSGAEEGFESLLAGSGDTAEVSDPTGGDAYTDREELSDAELNEFMVESGAADGEGPSGTWAELTETAQRELEAEKAAAREEPDDALASLMFVDSGAEKPAPSWKERTVGGSSDSAGNDISGLESLMFDGSEDSGNTGDAPGAGSEDRESVQNDIEEAYTASSERFLMSGEKVIVTEIEDLSEVRGEDISVFEPEEPESVGFGGGIEVTEYHDDSNDGEDFEIVANKRTAEGPTDTSGMQLDEGTAELSADGSVPLVNAGGGYDAVRQSMKEGKDAVRAYAYGSYENANAADEPVGFDGRRKGDALRGDPRLGDEMGSHSRNYKAQQIAPTQAPRREDAPATLKNARRSAPGKSRASVKTSGYSYGSKGILGGIAALLFGVIGAALWTGTGYLTDLIGLEEEMGALIQSVCAFLPALFAFVGYRIGGDCFDTKGIIISGIITLIVDALGAAAVFVTTELRWTEKNIGYSVPLENAVDRAVKGVSGVGEPLIYGKILIIAGVMVVALLIGLLVAKKKG